MLGRVFVKMVLKQRWALIVLPIYRLYDNGFRTGMSVLQDVFFVAKLRGYGTRTDLRDGKYHCKPEPSLHVQKAFQ